MTRFQRVGCLVLGAAFLIAGGGIGVAAAIQATEISAYDRAPACLAGAPLHADCLRPVDGAVTGVVETGGKSPDYGMDVRTAAGTLHITFDSDSPMLAYAVDGTPAVVTMWRGTPVSVSTVNGWSEPTAAVPAIAAAGDLGESEAAFGVGVFFVLGGLAGRRNRLVGRQPVRRPVKAACFLALGLGAAVVFAGGAALGGEPSRLGPDLAGTGAGLVVVLGLSAWLGVAVRRRNRAQPAVRPRRDHRP